MKLHATIAALVLGRADDSHFAATVQWLAANLSCRFVPSAPTILADGNEDFEPALVVLLQSRPGEFTDRELTALRGRWPIARFVAIAASWCEGEPRRGFAIGGVYRIPWHAALFRLRAELSPILESVQAPGVGLFGLPATATSDERLLANSRPVASAPAVVAVAAMRASIAEPLIDALGAAGHAAVYWPLDSVTLVRGIDAVVWDTFGCEQGLETVCNALPADSRSRPLIALADFPRPQDIETLHALGVDRVLGKPLLVADLLTCLDELLAAGRVTQLRKAAVA
jgi:hypothetical protein